MNINPYIIQRRVKNVSPAIAGKTTKGGESPERKILQTPFFERVPYTLDLLPLSRPPKSFVFTIGTTAQRIIEPPHLYPYLISNPSLSVGMTSSVVLHASGNEVAAGSSASLGVANYLRAHFHIDITAIAGTWDIYAQSLDPNSLNWADTQVIFPGLTTTGTLYSAVDTMGIATDLRIRWEPTVPGNITFSLTVTLKEGTVGSSAGLSRTVFIGGNDVTTNTGLPLFEGESRVVMPGPDVSLYGIAYTDIPIKVFVL